MGRKKGETIEVSVPAGVLKLKIVNISVPRVSERRRLDQPAPPLRRPHRDRRRARRARRPRGRRRVAARATGSPAACMGRRVHGQGARSSTSRTAAAGIQLLASADGLGEELFAAVCDTQLGDIVGVAGEAIRSRRGELSLRLEEFQLLAPCQHPLPDLHHGLADVEARYRQRYVDLMVNAGRARGRRSSARA